MGDVVFGESETNGERVDRSGDALNEKLSERDFHYRFFGVAVFDAFEEHFAADEKQKPERDVRNRFFKRSERFRGNADQKPARHRHQKLEKSERSGNKESFAAFHIRFGKSVGERNGKRVHRKPRAEQSAVEEK